MFDIWKSYAQPTDSTGFYVIRTGNPGYVGEDIVTEVPTTDEAMKFAHQHEAEAIAAQIKTWTKVEHVAQ